MRKTVYVLTLLFFAFNFYSCATKKPSKEEIERTVQYYFKMGVSYLNSGNVAEAIYNLNQAYAIKPKDPDILNALGIAYTKVGELDKAQEYFLKAIQTNPEKAESYVNLGILLAKKKDYGSAKNYFKKAIKNPNYKNKEKAYYNLALVYLKLGNLKRYEESLKKAIAYNNFFLPAYEELGNYYMQQDKYDQAKRLYEKAISLG
ncbi:tetratricopeptide repeat protein, partial [Hydrogenivirga sp. 128-5-R1-1]|uniref:tetratricopeptide repeat protein n=1 Tax=Hydrogenivirga sp. 128-5-R1-1 TaxID=392423 RepID=UPI00015F3A5A